MLKEESILDNLFLVLLVL